MKSENCRLWCIEQNKYKEEKESFYESIFSLGNGYMGVRGFHEESYKRKPHERCIFIAGLFDYIEKGITDMVNTPNYYYSVVTVNDDKFDFTQGKILEYNSRLDMKNGVLIRNILWENSKGQITNIKKERFISLDQIHLAVAKYSFIPINYSGEIMLKSGIDGSVKNNPINDDQLKENNETIKLLSVLESKSIENGGYIKVTTKNSHREIYECYTLDINVDEKEIISQESIEEDEYIGSKIVFKVQQGKEYIFEKYISVFTSRDGVKNIERETKKFSQEAYKKGFDELLKQHAKAWNKKWDMSDIQIEGDGDIQRAIRYNIFQLIQTNAERDYKVSIGARGIMHGRYKGCYFWDTEIFMLPFFIYTNPDAAKKLLLYRYHTLEGARANAKDLNLEGIKFPWMASIDGREQCESWDTGCCEIHINADIPYAIDHYYKATGDVDFILQYGAEIYIETARYWKSRFSYDEGADIYNMVFVKGPNEYGGVTFNNTYSTYMALNNFKLAIDAISLLKKKNQWEHLEEKLQFQMTEIKQWKKIIDKAVINYDEKKRLYVEDDHFYQLEPIDLSDFKEGTTPLYKKISFDRLQRFRVLKQADVILLMTLFPLAFSHDEKLTAWQEYEPITLHDSTLSFGTHSILAAMIGLHNEAYKYFEKSVTLDLLDVMKNTKKEGIHSASLGISWQSVIFGFAGLVLEGNKLILSPHIPKKWEKISFKLFYRNNIIQFVISHSNIEIQLFEGSILDTLYMGLFDKDIYVHKGVKTKFSL
jgi:trehalose/maltose hydrolase-like predicted phosphorylase